jgi:DDB1- and CUL4-associated factor 7
MRSQTLYGKLIQIEVVQVNEETKRLEKKFEFDHKYPATKIMWLPDNNNSHPDLMVTSGDVLKVWNIKNNEKAELKCALSGVSNINTAKERAHSSVDKL